MYYEVCKKCGKKMYLRNEPLLSKSSNGNYQYLCQRC